MPKAPSSKATETWIPVVPLRDTVHFPGFVQTLLVARDFSKRAIRHAQAHNSGVITLSQRDMALEEPKTADLVRVGVQSEIVQSTLLPDGAIRIGLQAHRRVRAVAFARKNGVTLAQIEAVAEVDPVGPEAEALRRALLERFGELIELDSRLAPEALGALMQEDRLGRVVDGIAVHLALPATVKQSLLEQLDAATRGYGLLDALAREVEVGRLKREVIEGVEAKVGAGQREYYLREQLRAIQLELGEASGTQEVAEWRERLALADLTSEARQRAEHEIERLEWVGSGTPEGAQVRNYLDWLLSMPWTRRVEERIDVAEAERLLDEAHYGLESVKQRILDYLAVRQLSRSLRGPILCFSGPPGMGKTSIARRVAEALGRPFGVVSLGGVRDEAEIRGHRRTYIGAQPGRIAKELRRCQASNPVILLDELDKLGADYRGDPAAALLEALDPALNQRFVDHYLEAPLDLSNVLFIATVNSPEAVLPALRDRLEVVDFPPYSDRERFEIASRYVLPRTLAEHGLDKAQLRIEPGAIERLASAYANELGVRRLERLVAEVCRKAARRIAAEPQLKLTVDAGSLAEWIGPPPVAPLIGVAPEVGLCYGIGVSEQGGVPMAIECVLLERAGPAPEVRITGNLGEVMRESVQAAVTYARSRSAMLGLEGPFAHDLHVHIGEGGIPKDGPSAGLAVALALCSAITGEAIPGDVAVSGEISLRGKVHAVGALREKAMAAARVGMRAMIAPKANEAEWAHVPEESRAKLKAIFVESIDEALTAMRELGSATRPMAPARRSARR